MSPSVSQASLLEGFGVILHYLLEAEADSLCGVSLYERSTQRVNHRSGFYNRKLSTQFGEISLRVPHLRYLHPRISMLKRAKRIQSSVFECLLHVHRSGTNPEQIASIIKSLWTIELPPALLAALLQQLVPALESWRSQNSKTSPRSSQNTREPAIADTAPDAAFNESEPDLLGII